MTESKVKDDNFFLVSGWMLNRLNLKGTALHVFAIIYGFSQDGEGSYTGSLQYLMDFTNTTKKTIISTLQELVEKGYLIKTENYINGVKFNTYKASTPLVKKLHQGGEEITTDPVKKLHQGGEEITPNNISINKSNINKDIVNEVIELYHSICISFPTIRAVSEKRKKAVAKLLKTYSIEDFRKVFENAEASSFLKGTDGGWKASFDWLIKEDNLLKVLEGNYADKPKYGRKEAVPGWMERKLDQDEEEAIRRVLREDPINDEELERLEAQQEKELAARAERLKRILGQEAI